MKTLPFVVITILFVATLTLHSQPAVYGWDQKSFNFVPNSLRIFHANGGNVNTGFPAERINALSRDLPIHQTKAHSSVTNLSGAWVKYTYQSQAWVKGAWVNLFYITNTYDESGYHTGSVEQGWDTTTNQWVDVLVESWTYDSVGNSIMYLENDWTGSQWATLRALNTFNADGYETNSLYQFLVNGTWVNSGLYSITYDTNGHPISEWQQMWSDSTWVNAGLITATYDTNGYRTSLLYQNWYDSSWMNYERETYTYDGNGNTTTVLTESWIGSTWVNHTLDSYTYDGNGLLITMLERVWFNSAWVNSIQDSYTNDANGNNTGILEVNWKQGAWVNALLVQCTWMQVSGISFRDPVAGETVLAGSVYTVRWNAPDVTSLKIEFSCDSGRTFRTIAGKIPADPGTYHWQVPDTLSAKCRIRITDADDPSDTARSGQFRIKPYILTRFKSNGDYEAFDPKVHGWKFANSQPNMWPSDWWAQFDYYGTDPNTGQRYPADLFQYPNVRAANSDFPDWPLVVRTFGSDVCYYDISVPVYSLRAFRYWLHEKGKWGGSCFGFSVGSLLDFDFSTAFRAYFPELGSFDNIHDLPINNNTRRVINQLFQYQNGVACRGYTDQQWNVTPRKTLEDLKSAFLSAINNAQPLALFDQRKPGGHSVVPYKMKRLTGTSDTYIEVYVYDNNCPDGDCGNGVQSILDIDSTQDAWSYRDMFGVGKGLFLHPFANTFLNRPVFPGKPSAFPQSKPGLKMQQTSGSYIQLMNSTTASIMVTNSVGDTIGFHDSTVVNSFSDGYPIIPTTSTYQPPIGYYIPDDSYSIRMSAYEDSAASFSAFGNATVFSYWRDDALNNQSDNLSYSGGIGYGNPDTLVKKVNLGAILSLSTSEHEFQILNCPAAQNDSLQMMVPDSTQLKLSNLGRQKTYDLSIVLAGKAAWGQFTHTSITVPAHSTQYIVPNWPDLTQPVKILEDVGNTGSINDSIIVSNQTTGVKESPKQGIPREFALEQNYPNPFNPSTTIQYELPSDSRVTLNVYNLLGQVVATLVNQTESAGYKSIHWNASSFASGIYFYRLEATSVANPGKTFTSVRKMVLMK